MDSDAYTCKVEVDGLSDFRNIYVIVDKNQTPATGLLLISIVLN